MRKLFTTITLIVTFITGIQAQSLEQQARNLINSNNQVEIKFMEQDLGKLKEVSKKISIDDYKNGEVTAFLSRLQIDDFLEFGYTFTIAPQNRAMTVLNVATTVAQMSNWDMYPSYNVYTQMMQDFATNYPNICKLDTIGESQNGRLILALKITDNPNIDENEPEFLYTGQMHGDEIVSGLLFLRLIDYLLSNYGTDAEITDMVNNIEIWINPVANMDGMYNGGNENVSNSMRYVANGVDLNRNFPNPVDGDHPDGNQWAQETIDMMAFCEAHDFVMAANSHSGAEVVNYPWDSWDSSTKVTADDNWWQFVSQEYADLTQGNSPTVYPSPPEYDYFTDVNASGFVNGGDWYVVTGSRQDYMNYFKNCREVTLELSSDKLLDSDLLPEHWIYNREALIQYLKQVQYGINGIITDNCTGNPIKAKIEIDNHDIDNSFVYSSLPIGNFHRPIFTGTYTVIISADGYQSQTFNNISVSNYGTTSLNVALDPVTPVADFTYELSNPCLGTYILTNNTGGDVSYQWTFPGGTQSTNENEEITFTENGTYAIQLEAINVCAGSNSTSQSITVSHLISTPTATDIERCGAGDVTFSATANGTGSISWFDAENGNLLSTNVNYTTNISTNTTIWVEETGNSITNYGAKPDNSGTGSFYTYSSEHALIFDCNEDLILKSVKVYADGTANRIIKLMDENSTILYEESFNIPDGESRVNLNWDIPVGVNFYLYGPASPDLFRNGSSSSSNLPYPYNIDSKISITGNTAGSDKYYYYFYDWEIETSSCSSPQIPVTATINPLAIANYTYNQNAAEISFTNTSTNGNSYTWDFGDGNTADTENTVHEYTENGDFLVTLVVTNACGTNSYSETVTITSIGINNKNNPKFNLYPNPANDYLVIESQTLNIETCEIIDITGKIVKTFKIKDSTSKISINDIEKGTYFIKLNGTGFSIIEKLIKL